MLYSEANKTQGNVENTCKSQGKYREFCSPEEMRIHCDLKQDIFEIIERFIFIVCLYVEVTLRSA